MARAVKEYEYAQRRKEIISVAQRFMYTKGFEEMSIQDILDELKISKGAFYHYFDSKPALLEALIAQMQEEAETLVLPILQDPRLSALEKLNRFFSVSVRWKTDKKDYMLEIVRVWYDDNNAIVRQKSYNKMMREFGPLMSGVIEQGIQEGTLNTPFPQQAGAIMLLSLQGLGNEFVDLLLRPPPGGVALESVVQVLKAYNDATERLLGADPGSLQLMDPGLLSEWFVTAPVEQEYSA